jgi:hypothetical protein
MLRETWVRARPPAEQNAGSRLLAGKLLAGKR